MKRQPFDPEILRPRSDARVSFPPEAWQEFHAACERLGVPSPTPARRTVLEALYSHLLQVNAWMNLTRLTEPADYLLLHVLDSLSALSTIEALTSPGDICVDLGSGGGYPGLPLAIWLPDRAWRLVDSRGRKAAFLSEAVKLTGCTNTAALAFRGREVRRAAPELVGVCRFVVARAAGRAANLLSETVEMLSLNGFLLLFKGPSYDGAEQNDLLRSCGEYGFELVREEALRLGSAGPARRLILLAKTEERPPGSGRSRRRRRFPRNHDPKQS